MRIADTLAAELAQKAWYGIDAPAAEPTVAGIRVALSNGMPGGVTLEDVGEWSQPMIKSIFTAPNLLALESRVVAAISAAMIVGAKLQETNGT